MHKIGTIIITTSLAGSCLAALLALGSGCGVGDSGALTQNLAAVKTMQVPAKGGAMCPPDKPLLKNGTCFPADTKCRPGYRWSERNFCRKGETCPEKYKKESNRCYRTNNSFRMYKSCNVKTGNPFVKTIIVNDYCKGCPAGYQRCGKKRFCVRFGWDCDFRDLYRCCSCGYGAVKFTDNSAPFCYTGVPKEPKAEEEYALTGGSTMQRNCANFSPAACGSGYASHCVVREKDGKKRCVWNKPGFPACTINGNQATCKNEP